jgi:hypothetical protein
MLDESAPLDDPSRDEVQKVSKVQHHQDAAEED